MFVLVSDDNVIAEINLVIFSSIVLNVTSKFDCPVELPFFTLFVVGLEMHVSDYVLFVSVVVNEPDLMASFRGVLLYVF